MIDLFKGNKEKRPNVIMILLDQFRNDARGVHPIFKKLASKGVCFERMITYAPYTLASVHATFTGMYGRKNGVDAYTKSDQYDTKNCASLPEYLRAAGYYTRGYSFSPILFPHAGFDSLKIVSEAEETDTLGHHREEIRACFSQKKPFFCYLHYGDIHHNVLHEVIQRYKDFDEEYFNKQNYEANRQRYLNYAREAGEYTAHIVDLIDSQDKDGNTLLILLTDHGASNGEKPGEKAYGIYTYDYSIHIWSYMVWPKKLPQGLAINSQIRSIDILPTLIDLIKLKSPKNKKTVQGRSLVPVIKGVETTDRIAFSETGGVDGPNPSPSEPNIKCVHDGRWKLIYNTTTNHFELYDIQNDPQETENLYFRERAKSDELWQAMINYI